ncbi:MAG TPA: hypothetical protein VEV43_05550 [Actinomycetota bacterium]|nr:hypothetical protein [Actinomycetota bacterium]
MRGCGLAGIGVALLASIAAVVPLSSLARGQDAAPEVRMEASAAVVTWGDAIRFTGTVSSPEAPECHAGVEVMLEMDAHDDRTHWTEVARARTDENGAFVADVRAEEPANYRMTTVPEEGSGCDAGVAAGGEVMVRFKVTLERSSLVVDKGEEVRLTVRVEPFCPVGGPSFDVRKIPLYELRGERFVRVAAKRDANDCTVTFTRKVRGLSVFMSKVRDNEELNARHLGGRSAEVAVTVRN